MLLEIGMRYSPSPTMSTISMASELDSDFYLDSGQDFILDNIKLEPIDLELYRAENDDPAGWCMEECSYDESPTFEMPNLPSPLNAWLPCSGDDMETETEDKLEDEQEQIVSCDWPRMESDWLVREMRGSDWLKPPGPDWQHQNCTNSSSLQNIEDAMEAAANTVNLLAKMKPCSVLLDPSVVKLYYKEQKLHLSKKKKKKKKKKKCEEEALSPIPKIKIKLASKLCYLEKSNPDYVFPKFIQRIKKPRKPCLDFFENGKELIYQCPYCYSIFKTEFEFRFHMSQKLNNSSKKYSVERKPQVYECINCLKSFENHVNFTDHMNDKHSLSVTCDDCEEQFTFVCQLNKHQHTLLHFISGAIECKSCGVDFPNTHCLDNHNLLWHQFNTHQCHTCSLYFESAPKLQCHEYLVHSSGLVTELDDLTQHNSVKIKKECDSLSDTTTYSNKSDTSWPCEKCNLNFTVVENFMSHWKTNHDSDPLPGWLREIIFFANPDRATDIFVNDLDIKKSENLIKVFKKEENGLFANENANMYFCEKCGKSLKSRDSLQKHVSYEHKFDSVMTKNFGSISCLHCSCSLENDELMYIHMLTNHLEFMQYQCTLCNLAFTTDSLFIRHFKKCHNTDKMFRCQICLSTFASSLLLGKHVKNSHGKKLVFCNHCKRDLNFNHFMHRHATICLQEENLVCCPFCEMFFLETNKFKTHVLEDHAKGRSVVHCEICLNSFFSKSNLASHIRFVHFKKQHVNKK